MAQAIVLEEFHITARAPNGLPKAEYAALRRALDGKTFQADLRRGVRAVFQSYPILTTLRISLTR